MRWPWKKRIADKDRQWLVANQAKLESTANKKLIAQLVKSDKLVAELRDKLDFKKQAFDDQIASG
jgi:hypothetical protein